jgi:hypothetical protein
MNELVFNTQSEGRYYVEKLVKYSDFPNLKKFIYDQKELYLKTKSTDSQPIWIDVLTTVGDVIDSYQSQSRGVRRKLKQAEEKHFQKAETNRLKNRSPKKLIDNLRYLLARAARLSTINFMPASVYDSSGLFKMLDRGNVMEEQIESVSTTHSDEKFTKQQVLQAIAEIEEAIGDSLPTIVKNWKESVKNADNNKKFSLFSIVGKVGIDSIRNEIVNVKIMVCDKIQAVNEMVSFNSKNNPWFGPHYLFQYLDIYNKIDNDMLFSELFEDGKYSNLKNFIFGKAEPEMWEALPQFPTLAYYISKKISTLDWDSTDAVVIKENQKLLIHAFEILSREASSKSVMDIFYKDFIGKDYNANKDIEHILKMASALDKLVYDTTYGNITDTFSKLQKAIDYVISNKNLSNDKVTYAKTFNKKRIKELIKTDSWKLLLVIPLSVLGPKFSQEDTSIGNVKDFLSYFEELLISPIGIKENAKGEPIDFSINSIELENVLTQQGTSYSSKLEGIYNYIVKAIQLTIDNVGDSNNDELKNEEIAFIDKSTGTRDWYWIESNNSGEMIRIGARLGKCLPATSWQHLEDKYNKWEYGCLQERTTNSGDNRRNKPNKLKSYQRKLEDVNRFFEGNKIDKSEYRASKNTLEAIIESIEELQLN